MTIAITRRKLAFGLSSSVLGLGRRLGAIGHEGLTRSEARQVGAQAKYDAGDLLRLGCPTDRAVRQQYFADSDAHSRSRLLSSARSCRATAARGDGANTFADGITAACGRRMPDTATARGQAPCRAVESALASARRLRYPRFDPRLNLIVGVVAAAGVLRLYLEFEWIDVLQNG